ncbi:hypothetical protein HWV62_42265 [Athelia sp. TMB]|nr:hypothetical protein HWV62_42265 [Athelia sp. TMB]
MTDVAQPARSVSRGRDSTTYTTDNSLNGRDTTPSRGRDLISTGRGGAGNIVRSPSRDVEIESKGHVNSADVASRALSTGRGGAGNIRSPSRDSPTRGRYDNHTAALLAESGAAAVDAFTQSANGAVDKGSLEYEREVLARHREAEARKGIQSTGRGGAGNILPSHTPSPNRSGSRSRSRAPNPPPVHSTGRGGAGNLHAGGASDAALEQLDEHERLSLAHDGGVHSTGRGGRANLTPALAPGPNGDLEGHHHAHPDGALESSGRGGAGNILRSREPSREGREGARAGSRERLGQLWNNLKHHGHHAEDPDAIKEVAGED